MYPLEAYGLLVGINQPPFIYAALPVGQTTCWGDPSDRFRFIPHAIKISQNLVGSLQMEILGLYHSHAEITLQRTALDYIPPQFLDYPVFILPIFGGELLWMGHFYRYDSIRGWQEQEYKKKTPAEKAMRFNPKRIGILWNKLWGVVEYHISFNKDKSSIKH